MLTCREVTSLVTDAAEGALPFRRRVSLWMHLLVCGACRRYRQQMALTRSALRQFARLDPASGVPPGDDVFERK